MTGKPPSGMVIATPREGTIHMRITHYVRLSNDQILYVTENNHGLEIGQSMDAQDQGDMAFSHSWICQIDNSGVKSNLNCFEDVDALTLGLKFDSKPPEREPVFKKIIGLFYEKLRKMTIKEWKAYLKKINLKSVTLMKAHQMLLLEDLVILPDPGKVQYWIVIPRQMAEKIMLLENLPE